jgi:uncharacterized membrane protein YuzA (DUF378 family)
LGVGTGNDVKFFHNLPQRLLSFTILCIGIDFCVFGKIKYGTLLYRKGDFSKMRTFLDRVALIIILIGAINWLCIGFFQMDLVATLFGGQSALMSRIVYSLVGLAGLYSISLLFRPLPEGYHEA